MLEYQIKHAERHQYTYTVGIAPPLQEIYVSQQADWRRQVPESGNVPVRLTLKEMLQASRHALVLADPGVGKSTAVAQVIWQQSNWLLEERHVGAAPYGPAVPFLLPADLHSCSSLAGAMAQQWESVTGVHVDTYMFECKPPGGEYWLILIDGVDQILDTDERADKLAFFGRLVMKSGLPYRLMITTRPLLSGELGLLRIEHIGRFTLRKFDDIEIDEFARRWESFRKSQHVPDLEIHPITSAMFIAAVKDASLTSLVKIPLIATITALILESAHETSLPTSLAGLYGRFVLHLFSSRRFQELRAKVPEQFTHSRYGQEAWAWLLDHIQDLLEGTADLSLSVGAPSLIQCAKQWVESTAPAALLTKVPGWDDALKEILTATSLVVPGETGLRFAHQNLAEYLAAAPRAARFELETWLADALSPDSRSLALLVLARELEMAGAHSGQAIADGRANLLLDRGGTDALIAGAIIAYGIDVSPVTYARVMDDLFDRLDRDQVDASQALDTLIDLTNHQDVVDRLTAFADDQAHPDWIRADVAAEMRAVSRATSVRLLRKVLYGTQDQLLQERILLTLTANGEKLTLGERARITTRSTIETAISSGYRAGHWYQQIAGDSDNDANRRLRALLAMAERRDPGWQPLLAEIITAQDLSDDTRLDAARRITRLAAQGGPGIIGTIADQPKLDLTVRVPLLASLAETQDSARQLLNRLAADSGPEFQDRFPSIAAWMDATGTRSSEQSRPVTGNDSAQTETASAIGQTTPPRNPRFTGREEILSQLRQKLASAHRISALSNSSHIVLQGLGGVGKTAIASEYAHRYSSDYDLVWWIPADQLSSVRGSLAMLAERLHVDPPPASGIDGLVAAVLDALRLGEPYSRWLLVFDNADQPEDIRQMIPHGPGHALITSRNHRWQTVTETVPMDVFLRKDSIEFLLKRVPQGLNEKDAGRLAKELGDLPLALEQAGAMLAETGMPADEYLRLLAEQVREIMAEAKPPDYTHSVTAAWKMSVDRIQQQLPQALELLRCCAFFGPEPIPRDIFRRANHIVDTELSIRLARFSEPIEMARAIRELGRYALVSIIDRSIVVHGIIAALIRDGLAAEEQANYRHDAHLLLTGAAPSNPDDESLWPRYAELLPHVVSSSMLLDECREAKVREFAMDMVRYLYTSGDPATSRQFAERCTNRWTADSGPSDPIVQTAQRHLNTALILLGERTDDE
jgi:hypothetical protein